MDVAVYFSATRRTRHASVHFTVVDCPSGDSLLDDPVLRQALKAIWDSTHTTGPANQRLERNFSLIDSAGVEVWRLGPQAVGDSPCWNSGGPNINPSLGEHYLYSGHSHGFSLGPPPDSLPTNCYPDDDPLPPGKYHAYAWGYGGFSQADMVTQTNLHSGFDGVKGMWVIDADSIYFTRGAASLDTLKDDAGNPILDSKGHMQISVPQNSWQDSTRSFARRQATCSII